jgi:hypothetical protein
VPATGEHADILRAIGRILDEHKARNIEIINHDAFMAITFGSDKMGQAQNYYQEHELESLRDQAKQLRKGILSEPRGGLAERLRTLGQEIDEQQAEITSIVQETDGLKVSGMAFGRYLRKTYLFSELDAISRRRRGQRARRPLR